MLDLVGDRAARRERGERALDRSRELAREHEGDEVFFRLRIEEDGPLRDASALGDGRRGGGLEPTLDEEGRRRIADAGALVFFVRLARHYDLGHL